MAWTMDDETARSHAQKKKRKKRKKREVSGVEARWPGALGEQFVPVSSFFLRNYTKLRPHPNARGLSSTEVMVLIHLLDHKWTDKAPFPTMNTLASRMGISARAVRHSVRELELAGYLERRRKTSYGPNHYYFEGLWNALNELQAQENALKAEAAQTEAENKEVT